MADTDRDSQIHSGSPMDPRDEKAAARENDPDELQMEETTESANTGSDVVTLKTWIVILALSAGYGISYFPAPAMAIAQSQIAVQFDAAAKASWVASSFAVAGTVAMMTCAPNSDLFGRRWFIIAGNLFVVVGGIVAGTAKSFSQLVAGMVLLGFGSGNAQMAAFAAPELLPNKWRPSAVVLADAFSIMDTILAPMAARMATRHGSTTAWRWLLYVPVIGCGIAALILVALYFPPKHPRGLPFRRALKELDYVGAALFTVAASLILVGINYASYLKSTNGKVIATLVTGFAALIGFACWETWAPLKQPLTPPYLFAHNKGRTLTAPFIVTLMVPIYYLGTAIVWSVIVEAVIVTPTSPNNLAIYLALPQGFACLAGGLLLALVGPLIQHWKWTQFVAVTLMTLFGGLLALVEPGRQAMLIGLMFTGSMVYSWAQFLSIAYCQFGAPQTELGISGGIAGVARFGGSCIATTVYTTILATTVTRSAIKDIVPAVVGAGGSQAVGEAVLAALGSGKVLTSVPGVTTKIAEAAGAAWQQCYISGIRNVAFSSLAFGGLGMVACLWCEDITPKMNNKIEVFLENDIQAEKNKYH